MANKKKTLNDIISELYNSENSLGNNDEILFRCEGRYYVAVCSTGKYSNANIYEIPNPNKEIGFTNLEEYTYNEITSELAELTSVVTFKGKLSNGIYCER